MLSTCIRNVIQKPNLNRKNKAYTTTTVLNDRNDIIFKIFNIYQTGDFIWLIKNKAKKNIFLGKKLLKVTFLCRMFSS